MSRPLFAVSRTRTESDVIRLAPLGSVERAAGTLRALRAGPELSRESGKMRPVNIAIARAITVQRMCLTRNTFKPCPHSSQGALEATRIAQWCTRGIWGLDTGEANSIHLAVEPKRACGGNELGARPKTALSSHHR